MNACTSRRPPRFHRWQSAFSLVEVMVTLAIGLVLVFGIFTLFTGMSSTNQAQQGLARLQENGRFALLRMETDLRMVDAQYCSVTAGGSIPSAHAPVIRARAPMVYARDLGLHDSGGINSILANGNASTSSATSAYVLTPRWFMQGYHCTGSSCTPAVPTGAKGLPAMGLAAGSRVPNSDVLTVRYQRGSGWPIPAGQCSISDGDPLVSGIKIPVSPQSGDDTFDPTAPGLVLVSDCISPAILPISGASSGGGNVTIGSILPGATGALCNGNASRDARLFDFSSDFVTVSYYLAFRSEGSDLIPTLIRRENGVEQELVRGVDQLRFRYGVRVESGKTRFMSAAQIQTGTGCTRQPEGAALESGCLWRSVRSIEPRLLVSSVEDVLNPTAATERSFRFDGTVYTDPAADDSLPSGQAVGHKMRREFIGYFSVRNNNF